MASVICIMAMCISSEMVTLADSSREVASGRRRLRAAAGARARRGAGPRRRRRRRRPACQSRLIMCAIKCVLMPNPATCYADCVVTDSCFTKTMATA
ncbi:hypothetical protein ABZP36_035466 [Zizania latifolia]